MRIREPQLVGLVVVVELGCNLLLGMPVNEAVPEFAIQADKGRWQGIKDHFGGLGAG